MISLRMNLGKRIIGLFLTLVLIIGMMPTVASAADANSGTANTTEWNWTGWTAINSAEDLSKIKNNMSGKFYLTSDISITSSVGTGATTTDFTGILDGNGHTITYSPSGSSSSTFFALFNTNKGTIRNLNVTVYINTTSAFDSLYIGGMVNTNNGTIANCNTTGTITATLKDVTSGAFIGGIAVTNDTSGTIAACSNLINITAAKYENQTISDSAYAIVGGMAAMNKGNIHHSISGYNSGGTITVDFPTAEIGGIAGRLYKDCTITNCSAAPVIEASGTTLYAGCIAGKTNDNANNISITSCDATGSLEVVGSETLSVGRIIGNAIGADVLKCNASGSMSVEPTQNGATLYVGGLVGYGNKYVTDSGVCNTASVINILSGPTNYTAHVGGIIGHSQTAAVGRCISMDTIQYDANTGTYVGGIIGYNDSGSNTNSFFLENNTSYDAVGNNSPSEVGQNSSFFANQTNFTNAGYDFENTWKMYSSTGNGATYPVLQKAGYNQNHDTVSSSYPAVAPTCAQAGNIAYSVCADCGLYFHSLNSKLLTIKSSETVLSAQHIYGEPEWIWDNSLESATALFTCTGCDTTEELTDSSISADGSSYTAEVSFEGKTYTDTYIKGNHENHCVCVGNSACSSHNNNTTWTAWTDSTSLPTAAGNYYLCTDVTLSATWTTPEGETNLCLNGYDITAAPSDSPINLLKVDASGESLSVTDCREVTGSIYNGTYGVYVVSGGNMTLWNGTISQCGYGIHSSGRVEIHGGKITNCSKTNGGAGAISYGAGIYTGKTLIMTGGEIFNNTIIQEDCNTAAIMGAGVDNKGTFTMSGGKIYGNTLGTNELRMPYAIQLYGAGVYNEGTFTMSGGEIYDNNISVNSDSRSAELIGAGVYNKKDSTFTMSGGELYDNTISNSNTYPTFTAGAGVYGNINLSGNVRIANNTIDGAASNLYLNEGEKITLKGALTGTNPIGVSMITPTVFTSGWANHMSGKSAANFFFSERSDNTISSVNSELTLAPNQVHSHCVCGKNSCGNHGQNVQWMPWYGNLTLPVASGNYYLVNDIQTSVLWKISGADVQLCLNDHDVAMHLNYTHINLTNIYANGSLVLTDCGTAGTFGGARGNGSNGGTGISNSGTMTLYNGIITDNRYGGISNYGTLNLFGGTITANRQQSTESNLAAGISAVSGTLNISGNPVVTGNLNKSRSSSNILLSSGCKLNIVGELTDGASIGISMAEPGVFTQNWSVKMSTDSGISFFTTDDAEKSVIRSGNELKLVHKTHSMTYSAISTGIQGVCDCDYTQTATLTVPQNAKYEENKVWEANLVCSDDWIGEVPAIAYTRDGVATDDLTTLGAITATIAVDEVSFALTYSITEAGSDGGSQGGSNPGSRPSSGSSGSSSGSGSSGSSDVTVPSGGENNSVKVEATVSGNKVSVSDVKLDAELDAETGDSNANDNIGADNNNSNTATITLDFSDIKSNAPITDIGIPDDVIKNIAETAKSSENVVNNLEIILPGGIAIEIDAVALSGKVAETGGSDVTISIKDRKNVKLTDAQSNAVGGRPAYDISILSGDKHISDMGSKITLRAPYELKPSETGRGIVVWYVSENGKREKCETKYDYTSKSVTWETDHLSLYMIDYDETLSGNPFIDVAEDDYYFDAVLWALDNGITGGITDNKFAPNAICTRAQMVTFLWRAAGYPESANGNNPFEDVSSDDYYNQAVQWAYEQGITGGVSDTEFDPNAACLREHMATFLWRVAGCPDTPADGSLPFRDVPEDKYYSDAVQWVYENGITNGTNPTAFSPEGISTRAQMITFLYRYFAE